jgi:hypothetical protein
MVPLRLSLCDRHSLPEQSIADGQSAVFSPCGRYRWWLRRLWNPEGPTLLFLGLNPSRANGQRDDPTLRRLVRFAAGWGYGSLEVLNLFSRVGANPAGLRRCRDPVGASTDAWIRWRLGEQPGPVQKRDIWLGWGNGGRWLDRDRQMLELLEQQRSRPLCLGLTASGQPRHPLYQPATGQLEPFASS